MLNDNLITLACKIALISYIAIAWGNVSTWLQLNISSCSYQLLLYTDYDQK